MRGEIFLKIFLIGLVFNWMGMFFLYRLRSLARDNALYGADASVRERDEGDGMECSGKGRRGARWHRGDVKKGGGRFLWLQRCYLFSAALSKVQSSTGASDPTGSFFRYGTGFLWGEWI